MNTPFFATPHNIDTNEWSDRTGLHCKDPTLAQQHFKDECDINILFGKYLETGEMPQVMDMGLSYGNFEGIFDFQSAMNAVREAEHAFSQLPARIKNRFDNNPQKLLDFLHDPENRAEAEFLGLVDKPKGDHETGSDGTTQKGAQAQPGPSGAPSNPPPAPQPGQPGPQADPPNRS